MTRADVGSALAVVLLLAVAVAADRWARLGQARQVLVAGLRAVVQLAVVGVVVACRCRRGPPSRSSPSSWAVP